MNLNYPIRAVQLDLARQMESMEFIKNFIDFLAENHYNTLQLYLEWRVRTKTFDIGKKEGYSAEEITEIVDYAALRGIDVIPGLAALGHSELILGMKKYASYAELREGIRGRFSGNARHVFCPSLPETRKFLESYFTEVASLFKSPYLHVGGDEAWDIGFCPLCKKKAETFAGEQELYLEHFKFCHEVVTKKLHRRMMMWDDMFEFYGDILEKMPRDVIMVNWQYQMTVTGYRGHFANQRFSSVTEKYKKLGFDYLIAPTDAWPNVESFTNHEHGKKPLGGLLTTWEKSDRLLFQSYPVFAATGWLWSGMAQDGTTALLLAAKQLFGVEDELFLHAVRQYCICCSCLPGSISRGDLMSEPFHGPDAYKAFPPLQTMLAILSAYSGKLKDSRAEVVLSDMMNDTIMKILALRSRTAAFQILHDQEAESVDGILEELSVIEKKQIAACLQHRRKCDAAPIQAIFARWREALQTFSADIGKNGMIRFLFCLPDAFCAERLRIFVRSKGTWQEIASGCFKNLSSALYQTYFFLPKDRTVESVRIEASGFGGQGICYVSARTGKGEFVPAGITAAGGVAEHPEHLLNPDATFCYLGTQSVFDAFHDRSKADVVHFVEIAMKNIK